jgi:hypothetical protein
MHSAKPAATGKQTPSSPLHDVGSAGLHAWANVPQSTGPSWVVGVAGCTLGAHPVSLSVSGAIDTEATQGAPTPQGWVAPGTAPFVVQVPSQGLGGSKGTWPVEEVIASQVASFALNVAGEAHEPDGGSQAHAGQSLGALRSARPS